MFTGIVETLATLKDIRDEQTNRHFTFHSAITQELSIDQSLSHNGVCLTVVAINSAENTYTVTAIEETLKRTNLAHLLPQKKVNLERCLKADGRLDGHIVQGHVDTVGVVESITDHLGSWKMVISHAPEAGLTVEKGSIAVNGVSLTVVKSEADCFSVAIIPYTWEFTNFHELQKGDLVNLEFDILGKYLRKLALIQIDSKSK